MRSRSFRASARRAAGRRVGARSRGTRLSQIGLIQKARERASRFAGWAKVRARASHARAGVLGPFLMYLLRNLARKRFAPRRVLYSDFGASSSSDVLLVAMLSKLRGGAAWVGALLALALLPACPHFTPPVDPDEPPQPGDTFVYGRFKLDFAGGESIGLTLTCYCASCANKSLPKATCASNQAASQAVCSAVPRACPAIACVLPPTPACVSGMCSV
jgi:hypothetical protein